MLHIVAALEWKRMMEGGGMPTLGYACRIRIEPIHCSTLTQRWHSGQQLRAQLFFVKERPCEQVSTSAGGSGPSHLGQSYRSPRAMPSRPGGGEVRSQSAEIFDLCRTFAGASGLLWFWNGSGRFGNRQFCGGLGWSAILRQLRGRHFSAGGINEDLDGAPTAFQGSCRSSSPFPVS